EACAAIQEGVQIGRPKESIHCETLPVADGGDGIASTLTHAQKGTWKTLTVPNALGNPVEAGYGLIENGDTAIIEMAEASGLARLDPEDLRPEEANTFGTGELIRDAMTVGAKTIVLGLGGSATNDAGTGMAQALGWKFFGASGKELDTLPRDLKHLDSVEAPFSPTFPQVTVACDVSNPLLGPNGCTRVYGPQKGIIPDDFEKHEDGLTRLVESLQSGKEANLPGAGAAGGLGFGSVVFLNASLTPGFDLVADILHLEESIRGADIVVTGEGRLDQQSLEGKAPYGVAKMARELGKPVVTFCGILESPDLAGVFGRVFEIRKPDLDTSENMARGRDHLIAKAAEWARSLPE
ncbi:MAG: glycerate kinase, partial [Verrucomicrobiota bacterium]